MGRSTKGKSFIPVWLILAIVGTALGIGMPATVHAGGVQTLEEVDVTDSSENLVGSANSATEGTVTQRQLETRPILRTGELLETVPGVVITQHSGAGKANQYFLRGFNLDHGTDLATTVDGMPVNMRTHGHGHGYTDVNFVIPELVKGLQYKKGPYYADEGDFASAGAVNMIYATSLERGVTEMTYGDFRYRRLLAAGSPKAGSGVLLYGFEMYINDGPWIHPDDYQRVNGVLRYTLGGAQNQWSMTLMSYNGQWDASDQLAQTAIDDGTVDRFGALDDTTGGKTHRYSLSTDWQQNTGNTSTKANAYLIDYKLDLFSNFTYFLDDPVNGDQFEQFDDRIVGGANVSRVWIGNLLGRDMDNTIGLQARYDDISPIGLYHTAARQRLTTVRQDEVKEGSIGVYFQNGTRWTEKFRTVVGIRGDVYQFKVDSSIAANSGDETAGIVSPKLAMILGPWNKTEYYVNAGMAFHSNDARGTTITVDPVTGLTVDSDGNPIQKVDPLVRTKGAEVGVRTAIVSHLQSSLSVWLLDIDSELLFVGDAGITEPGRSTRRVGVEFANYYTPVPWLILDADLAFTRARFTESDPTDPALGDNIPNSIERVITAGITLDNLDGPFGSIRVRHFAAGPLNEDNTKRSDGSTLVNAQAGYKLTDRLRVAAEVFNLLDAEVNDIEYYYESQVSASGTPQEDYHIHPSEPRNYRVSMTYNF